MPGLPAYPGAGGVADEPELVPDPDALICAVSMLASAWADCQEDLIAVIPIAVPQNGWPETAPPPYFVAMADDREAGRPGSMAVALNAAVSSADRIARLMLAARPGFTAWARVERSGAYNVIRQRLPHSGKIHAREDREHEAIAAFENLAAAISRHNLGPTTEECRHAALLLIDQTADQVRTGKYVILNHAHFSELVRLALKHAPDGER